jgi:zinc transporter ZupT
MLELIAAASATALATGLGAIPVWLLGERAELLKPALTGLAAGVMTVAAIAIQNIPEGTSVAIPMEAAGMGHTRQFWAAVLTSVPQPVGAVLAYILVEQISSLLPLSFAFAAGAMLMLVIVELGPRDGRAGYEHWAFGALVGAGAMFAISRALAI